MYHFLNVPNILWRDIKMRKNRIDEILNFKNSYKWARYVYFLHILYMKKLRLKDVSTLLWAYKKTCGSAKIETVFLSFTRAEFFPTHWVLSQGIIDIWIKPQKKSRDLLGVEKETRRCRQLGKLWRKPGSNVQRHIYQETKEVDMSRLLGIKC